MKNKITIIFGIFLAIVSYIISLFYISDYQKKYHVNLYPKQNEFSVSVDYANTIAEFPITVENATNKCVSTQLEDYLIYEIDGSSGDYIVSYENPKTTIPNIYPDEIKDVDLQVVVPDKVGTYIVSVNIEDANGIKMSESGLVPAEFTIEVY